MNKKVTGKNLTREAPRSPRIRVGGYAILGRTIDKCRALVAGDLGEYHFDCPLDRTLFGFKGVQGEDFRAQIENGASDQEVVEWLNQSGEKKTPDAFVQACDKFIYTEVLREVGFGLAPLAPGESLALIRGTVTETGLKVEAFLVSKVYAAGLKVADAVMKRLNIERHAVCPNWFISHCRAMPFVLDWWGTTLAALLSCATVRCRIRNILGI